MRNKLGIALCFIGAVVIVSWIMCCAKVLAHDTVEIRDGKDVHDAKQEREMNAERGKDSHWHFGAVQSGAWDRCIADTYDAENHEYRPDMCDEVPPPEPPPPSRKTSTREPEPPPPVTTPNTITVILDDAADQDTVIPDTIKEMVDETPEPEMEDKREWQVYEFHQGWNLVMFSVLPEDVTNLEGLHTHLIPDTVLVVNVGGCWLMYQGKGETGEIKLHPNMGIAVYAPMPFSVTLIGHRIKLVTSFPIHAGLNLIGFSQPPPELETPSDLLSETGICVVVRGVGDVLYLIGRVGDRGDTELRPNEAFMAISLIDYDLDWYTPAAPAAPRMDNMTTSWGAMKR